MKLFVCTWKWNDPAWKFHGRKGYTSEHVNTLKRMVDRHLQLPHEICCITDDPAGIDSDVRIIPLWDDLKELGGCWRRLKAFAPEMRELIGPRFCSIDLDVLICGDITPILIKPTPFVIWKDYRSDTKYNGGFWMMDAGVRSRVWDWFVPKESPQTCRGLLGTDQAWLNRMLYGEQTWGTREGVYSYRWHVLRNGHGLPPGARMVFFHGPYDPASEQLQARHPWIKEHYR